MPGALVLSRGLDESIVIDGETEVQVARIEPGNVRLAFRAPSDVPIVRKELIQSGLAIHARFEFFVGLQNTNWIRQSEIGSGPDVKSARRDARKRLASRLARLQVAFIAPAGEIDVVAAVEAGAVR